MNKKVLFSLTALVAAALTSFTAYKSFTPQLSEADILINENIEALTQNEDGAISVADCYYQGSDKDSKLVYLCPDQTTYQTIYPCPGTETFLRAGARGTCYKKQ